MRHGALGRKPERCAPVRTNAVALAAALLLAPLAWTSAHAADGRNFLSVYAARNSSDRLVDILRLRAATNDDAWLGAAAWGFVFARGTHTRWELEGQIVRHGGLQDHWEANVVAAVRWMDFPWDEYVDTRIAFGNGISYASEVPPIEPRGDVDDDEQSRRLLNYTMVEVEFTSPPPAPWSTFIRVHHRSGVFGAFGNVRGGSNFVGIGLRYYLGEDG